MDNTLTPRAGVLSGVIHFEYNFKRRGEILSYDALIISLGILSMPGDLLLFCEYTARLSSVRVKSVSKSSLNAFDSKFVRFGALYSDSVRYGLRTCFENVYEVGLCLRSRKMAQSFYAFLIFFQNFFESFLARSFKRLPSLKVYFFCALYFTWLYFVRDRVNLRRFSSFLLRLNIFRTCVNSSFCMFTVFVKPLFIWLFVLYTAFTAKGLAESIKGFIIQKLSKIFNNIIHRFI